MAFTFYAAKVLGIRIAHAIDAQHSDKIHDKSNRYSGVPVIPGDIGFKTGKATGGEVEKGSVVSRVASNPFVVFGMGLTTMALLGMMRKSFIGDRMGAQRYMQLVICDFVVVGV